MQLKRSPRSGGNTVIADFFELKRLAEAYSETDAWGEDARPKEGNLMCFEALRAVLKITGLPAPQEVVLLHLADFADDNREAWPKIKTLAELAGLSERATHNAVKELVKIGLITKRRSQYSSRYTVNVEGSRSARGKEPNESRYAPDAELTCTKCDSDMPDVRFGSGRAVCGAWVCTARRWILRHRCPAF